MRSNYLLIALILVACPSCMVTRCRYGNGLKIEMPSLHKQSGTEKKITTVRVVRRTKNINPETGIQDSSTLVAKFTTDTIQAVSSYPTPARKNGIQKKNTRSGFSKKSARKTLVQKRSTHETSTMNHAPLEEEKEEEENDLIVVLEFLVALILLGVLILALVNPFVNQLAAALMSVPKAWCFVFGLYFWVGYTIINFISGE
jgi:hypothetical protein